MNNSEQTMHRQGGQFLSHEMAQPFVDWVQRLTFMKTDMPNALDLDHLEDKSVEYSSVHNPAASESAGQPPVKQP